MTAAAEQGPIEDRVLFMEARLRIATIQLHQAESLRDAESRRLDELVRAPAGARDGDVLSSAHLRTEIAEVAASAAEGQVEQLRMQLAGLVAER